MAIQPRVATKEMQGPTIAPCFSAAFVPSMIQDKDHSIWNFAMPY